MRPLFSSVLCVGALLVPSMSFSQPKPKPTPTPTHTQADEARQRFFEGMRASDAGDFEKARLAYLQAYALVQMPEVLRNLGIAELRTQHLVLGARHLAAYLRGEPAKTETPSQRTFARELLTKTEAKVSQLAVEVDVVGADIVVDGELIGRSPVGFVWHAEPGKHTVTARKGEVETTKQIETRAGEVSHVALGVQAASARSAPPVVPEPVPATHSPQSLQPIPASTPIAAPEPANVPEKTRARWPLYLTGGVALAGLTAGIVGAVSAASNRTDIDNSSASNRGCGAGTPSNSECARLSTDIDHYERNVRISRVGWGAFGVASAAGLLYLTWPLFSGTSPAANVTATVAFQRLEISGRF